jgi:hypothetical protein
MNKSVIFGFVIIVATLVLSACGASKTAGQKAAEKILEAQTGGKVKVDSNGENVTIKTEEGQTQYSAGGAVKLPDNFPKDLIVVDDAKLIVASSSEQGGSVAYLTNFDQTEVFEKYLKDLPAAGWKKEMEVSLGEGKMINFSKDKESVSIVMGANTSKDETAKTTVNITLVLENK